MTFIEHTWIWFLLSPWAGLCNTDHYTQYLRDYQLVLRMHFEGASNYPHCIIQYLFSCVESTVTTFPYRERWYIFIPIVLKSLLNDVPRTTFLDPGTLVTVVESTWNPFCIIWCNAPPSMQFLNSLSIIHLSSYIHWGFPPTLFQWR